MNSTERVILARGVILGLLELPDINEIHEQYLTSVLNRIDNEIMPYIESIPEEAAILLFTEVLKSSSIILFSKDKKPASSKITKKVIKKYFPENKITIEGLRRLKGSRYGLNLLKMNINQFFSQLMGDCKNG